MKLVSVVVPCYNAFMYLEKCIEHLLIQTIGLENIEIILVDDASTDGGATLGIIMQYEQKYPENIIAVSLEENVRQGGARNVGVSYANGQYLIFCDADDWLLKETLEHCYIAAKEYDADVVEFAGRNVTDRDAIVELEIGGGSRLVELVSEENRKSFLLYVNEDLSLGSQTKFYRLSLIKEKHISFVEHLFFEEPSFVIPVRLYEKRHLFLDERLYVWYLSQGSTLRSNWEREHKWDNLQAWVFLMQDLSNRGMLLKYSQELEYLFFNYALVESVEMLVQRGCQLLEEELRMLADVTLRIFPDILQNQFVRSCEDRGIWNRQLAHLLQLG